MFFVNSNSMVMVEACLICLRPGIKIHFRSKNMNLSPGPQFPDCKGGLRMLFALWFLKYRFLSWTWQSTIPSLWMCSVYTFCSMKMAEFIGGRSISKPITMIYNLLPYFLRTFYHCVWTFCQMDFLHIQNTNKGDFAYMFFYFFREIHGCLLPSCLPRA